VIILAIGLEKIRVDLAQGRFKSKQCQLRCKTEEDGCRLGATASITAGFMFR